MSRASVLLVDDEPVFGETTAELLRRHGYDCDVARCVDEAQARLQARAYDALVADIMMPGNAGMELLQVAQSRHPGLPIILVTGYPSVETAVQSLDHGVFAYKIKPFDLDDFLDTVAQAVRRGRLQQGLREEASRAEALSQRLRELAELSGHDSGSEALDLTARQYLRVVLASVSESLLEALGVLDLVDMPAAELPLRKLAQHPDAIVYRQAINETMAVLESTKGAFKSRELADLRRKLGALMHVTGQ